MIKLNTHRKETRDLVAAAVEAEEEEVAEDHQRTAQGVDWAVEAAAEVEEAVVAAEEHQRGPAPLPSSADSRYRLAAEHYSIDRPQRLLRRRRSPGGCRPLGRPRLGSRARSMAALERTRYLLLRSALEGMMARWSLARRLVSAWMRCFLASQHRFVHLF